MYMLLYCFWLILNGRVTVEIAVFGLGVVGGVGALCWALFGYTPRREAQILRRVPLFLCYAAVLIWEIGKANLAVMRLIAHPGAIDPTLVTFTTSLRTGMGRFLLANSITLTPGTITVRLEGDRLTVHCLSRGMLDTSPDSVFERWLRRLEA